MRRNTFTHFSIFLALTLFSNIAFSQGSDLYGSGMKFKLNEDGSKYMRFITWHQVWARYSENNSNSARQGVPQDETFDIGVRRSRFLFLSQISPRFLILMHAGINNQTSYTGGAYSGTTADAKKPQLFIHDLWNEYKVVNNDKFKLDFGAGLHYWHGVSRMSNASTLNFLAMDAPIFNWPNIETNDQFARYLGLYAKGKLGKLDYRFNVSEPFYTNTAGAPRVGVSTYSPRNVKKIYAGYVSYQFFEQESNLLPFTVGSYLGSKKVFNLGAGFQNNNEAMWTKKESWEGVDSINYHNQNLFSVDAFLDLPLNKESGTAITAYLVNYIYDFGPNFVRAIGIMNPAVSTAPGTIGGNASYRGNAVPTIGTGNTFYAQVGFLLPKTLSSKFRLQPYVCYTNAQFEGLKNAEGSVVPVQVVEGGANFLLEGHHAKITLHYRHRPDFTDIQNVQYRPEATIQFMVYL